MRFGLKRMNDCGSNLASQTKSGKVVVGSSQGEFTADNDGHAENDVIAQHARGHPDDPLTHLVSFGNSSEVPGVLKGVLACGDGSSKEVSCKRLLTEHGIKFLDSKRQVEVNRALRLPTNHDIKRPGSLSDEQGNSVGPALQRDGEGKPVVKTSPGHLTHKTDNLPSEKSLLKKLKRLEKGFKKAKSTGDKRLPPDSTGDLADQLNLIYKKHCSLSQKAAF